MPVIYMLKEQSSLGKEPYVSFDKKFKMISESIYDKEIELPIGRGKVGQFHDGFYHDDYNMPYQRNMTIKFTFAKMAQENTEGHVGTFIRGTCSFEYNESDVFDYHLARLKALSLRADYFYIPNAEYLEISYNVDAEISIHIDAIVMEPSNVQQVCHSMLNQYISIFSLDD